MTRLDDGQNRRWPGLPGGGKRSSDEEEEKTRGRRGRQNDAETERRFGSDQIMKQADGKVGREREEAEWKWALWRLLWEKPWAGEKKYRYMEYLQGHTR